MNALLVFSYDTSNPLLRLREELTKVAGLLQTPSFVPSAKWQCDADEIRQFFDDYKENVRIFHFGGHALGSHLQLNDSLEPMRLSFVEALAARICQYGGLKLVFLNGCSTNDQAQAFLANGAAAVISTRLPVKDSYGLAFASLFYKEFCKNNKSLQQAFDDTLLGFLSDHQASKADWLNRELAEANRGFVADETEDVPLYHLLLHPAVPQTATETFRQWHPLQPAATPTAIEMRASTQLRNLGVAPDSYLLVNRRREVEEFKNRTREKLNGTCLEPLFFFIHDYDKHCPFELSVRFRKYPPDNFQPPAWKEIELESLQGQFFDGDRYKLALSELYARQFSGIFHQSLNRWVLQKMRPDNSLLIVFHDLTVLDWEDEWETFFRYYTTEYARQLSQELSSRLVVICLRECYEDEDPFGRLFDQLATENAGQVACFSGLPDIKKNDIGSWQREVFQETFFTVDEIFTAGDGSSLTALPFIKAKDKLADKIREFNLKKAQKTFV